MESTLEKIQFRLNQSREKIKLASIFLEKKNYCDSVLASYRAIFYAIRVLLIDKDIDSDDPDRIIEIFEKYLESTLFGNTKIIEIAKRSKELKDYAVNSNGHIQCEHAQEILRNATTILNEIERHYSR